MRKIGFYCLKEVTCIVEKMTRRNKAFRTQFSLNGKKNLCGFWRGLSIYLLLKYSIQKFEGCEFIFILSDQRQFVDEFENESVMCPQKVSATTLEIRAFNSLKPHHCKNEVIASLGIPNRLLYFLKLP